MNRAPSPLPAHDLPELPHARHAEGVRDKDRGDRTIRRISVIAPMYNEAQHVEGVVADLAAQDFEGEVELLIADGGSTDGSRERVLAAGERYRLPVRMLENPYRWVSPGLNACIRVARGDLIVRIDCHSRYPRDYLSRCALVAEETGAENVGGIVIAKGRTPTERAVASAMSSAFGGIGWTRHGSEGRVEVDTVTCGAFRPEAFERAGLFDESLVRNQDDEFNLRLRRAGGRVVLDPSIRLYYTPRGRLSRVFRQYYEYGLWKVPVMRKHSQVLGLRSLAGGAFVTTVVILASLAPWVPRAGTLLVVGLGAYAALALTFGAVAVHRRGEQWRLLPRVIAVFPAFHIGHGIGMVHGWLRAILR